MRHRRNALFLSALMLASCTYKINEPVVEVERKGEISISLSVAELPYAKAQQTEDIFIPELDDIKVEIFKNPGPSQVRLYRELYGNIPANPAPEEKIVLNCGDYRMLASYGDSLATGVNKPYYAGICDFTLAPQEKQTVSAEVRVSNVRASVEFDSHIGEDYPGAYAVVKSVTKGGRERQVQFEFGDDRAMFLPLGDLYLEWYVEMDGKLMYYPAPVINDVKPGDDFKFKVHVARMEGTVTFTVTIIQPGKQPVIYEVSDALLSKEQPKVDCGDFNGEVRVAMGDDVSDLNYKMDVVADGKVQDCWLNISSEYIRSLGVPSEVNLADPALAAEVKSALESVGIRWMENMRGRRLAYVDFTGVAQYLSALECDVDKLFEGDFFITVVDQREQTPESLHVGTVVSETVTFLQGVPKPEININGFDEVVSIMEAMGVRYDNLKAHVEAKGRIGGCMIEIDSPYLKALGIPAEVDLVSADAETLNRLKEVGISWPENIGSLTRAEIDFSGLTAYMDGAKYDSTKGTDFASFGISVRNEIAFGEQYMDAEASVGSFCYLVPSSPSATGNILPYNIWSKKIYDYSTQINEGNLQRWKLQYSSDGTIWNEMTAELDQNRLVCQELNGLLSSAENGVAYDVRAIYNENQSIVYPLQGFVTEAAAQVGNSGFETWQDAVFNYVLPELKIGYGSIMVTVSKRQEKTRTWYLPYQSESSAWWAVNSRITMPAETTPEYQEYKVFPAVSYSNDSYSGSKSAQMAGVYVCNMATNLTAGDGESYGGMLGSALSNMPLESYQCAGEIFIGTANNGGGHASEGHAFYSRPQKLRFRYKYSSYNSEQFQVKAWVKNEAGQIIASGQTDSGPASSSWAEYVLPLTYAKFDSKAASIFISFRSASCKDDEIGYDLGSSLEMGGTSYKGHIGSVLKIDNLELIYE